MASLSHIFCVLTPLCLALMCSCSRKCSLNPLMNPLPALSHPPFRSVKGSYLPDVSEYRIRSMLSSIFPVRTHHKSTHLEQLPPPFIRTHNEETVAFNPTHRIVTRGSTRFPHFIKKESCFLNATSCTGLGTPMRTYDEDKDLKGGGSLRFVSFFSFSSFFTSASFPKTRSKLEPLECSEPA